jgi:hypothetical protein
MCNPDLPDRIQEEVLRGVALFNEGDYHEAHEVWEKLWVEERRPLRRFYQGLIQSAVAMYHHRRGRVRPALNLIERARGKLTTHVPVRMQVDVAELLRALDRCEQEFRHEQWRPVRYPRIRRVPPTEPPPGDTP